MFDIFNYTCHSTIRFTMKHNKKPCLDNNWESINQQPRVQESKGCRPKSWNKQERIVRQWLESFIWSTTTAALGQLFRKEQKMIFSSLLVLVAHSFIHVYFMPSQIKLMKIKTIHKVIESVKHPVHWRNYIFKLPEIIFCLHLQKKHSNVNYPTRKRNVCL